MEWHPYSKLFPMLPDKELQKLADDIRENGQRHKILVDTKNRIIDGRNRAAACELAQVKPATKMFDGSESEILSIVVSENLRRRHLDEGQRAMIAAEIANIIPSQRKKDDRRQLASVSEVAVSQAEAARLMNTSKRSVSRAKSIKENGVPEVQEAVVAGSLSLSKAESIARLPKKDQPAALSGVVPSTPAPQKAVDRTPRVDDAIVKDSSGTTSEILKQVSALGKSVTAFAKTKAGAFVNAALVNRVLKELRQELQRAVLAQPCKDCKGKGCMLCKDVGYVTAGHYE